LLKFYVCFVYNYWSSGLSQSHRKIYIDIYICIYVYICIYIYICNYIYIYITNGNESFYCLNPK